MKLTSAQICDVSALIDAKFQHGCDRPVGMMFINDGDILLCGRFRHELLIELADILRGDIKGAVDDRTYYPVQERV
jgi:hypothetical protein